MKKILTRSFATLTILAASTAHANFTFQAWTDNCADLGGLWQGRGHASNYMVDCYYRGTATIAMLDGQHFSFDVSVDKEKGSFLCPSHEEQHLTASCSNGNITILTEYGDLSGTVNHNQGTAKGTITLFPGVKADVDVNFNRS